MFYEKSWLLEGGDLAVILEDSAEYINVVDKFGQTPLSHAARKNDVNAIRRLLSYGADPNIVDVFGDTPLIHAAYHGSFACIYALIDGGCDINKTQEHRHSAFERLIMSKKEGSAEVANFFVKNEAGLSLDPAEKRLAIHFLVRWFEAAEIVEKFELLVRAGIELEAKDYDGNTPLDDSIRENNVFMLRLLMGAGCKLSDTPGKQNSLRLAARYSSSVILHTIDETSFTMDVRWRDQEGNTALDSFDWRMVTSLLPANFQKPSDDNIEAFRKLLSSVRDRYLSTEIQNLELVTRHLKEHNYTLARVSLDHVIKEKIKWEIPAEYRTFRAVDVQIKEDMIEAAIESLEEFMEVSRSRIGSDPFVGDYCRAQGLKNQGLIVKDMN
ncbi:hypothetical protein ABKA04_007189 [Annulohypoxylon sp. FPYF3050]